MITKPLSVAVTVVYLICQRGTFDGTDHSMNGKTFFVPNHHHAVVVAFVKHNPCNYTLANKTRCHSFDS